MTQNRRRVQEAVSKGFQSVHQELVANGCLCEGKETEAAAILNAKGLGSLQDVTDAFDTEGEEPSSERIKAEDTPDDYDEDEDPATDPDRVHIKKGKMTDNQYLATLPPRIRNVVSNSLRREQEHRNSLIGALTANVGDQRQLVADGLNRLSTEQLEAMAQGAPTANQDPPLQFNPPNYIGQGGNGFAPVKATAKSRDNILPVPTMNWAEIAKENAEERHQRVS